MKDGKDTGPSQSLIDQNLQLVYRETVEEELPERFVTLLAQLKRRDTQSRQGPEHDRDAQRESKPEAAK